jgi:hypothetical protein
MNIRTDDKSAGRFSLKNLFVIILVAFFAAILLATLLPR